MARTGRFVKPETVRIHLADGESWIEIKKYLTAQEQRRIESYGMERMVRPTKIDDASAEAEEVEVKFDWVRWEINRILTYLLAWNFVDIKETKQGPREEPVKVSRNAVAALDPDTFSEIQQAITDHVEVMEQEKKARKEETAESPSEPGETTGKTAEPEPEPT